MYNEKKTPGMNEWLICYHNNQKLLNVEKIPRLYLVKLNVVVYILEAYSIVIKLLILSSHLKKLSALWVHFMLRDLQRVRSTKIIIFNHFRSNPRKRCIISIIMLNTFIVILRKMSLKVTKKPTNMGDIYYSCLPLA